MFVVDLIIPYRGYRTLLLVHIKLGKPSSLINSFQLQAFPCELIANLGINEIIKFENIQLSIISLNWKISTRID